MDGNMVRHNKTLHKDECIWDDDESGNVIILVNSRPCVCYIKNTFSHALVPFQVKSPVY